MRFRYIIRLSTNNFMHKKLRSWLTILGIVIGVAAVIAILSISSGAQQSISSQLGGLGADMVTVSPGFSRAMSVFVQGGNRGGNFQFGTSSASSSSPNMTIRDLQVIRTVDGVKFAGGLVSGRADITYLAETASISITGVDPLLWKDMTTDELESGRYLAQGDVNVVVIGYGIANDMFKKPLTLNAQVTIGGKLFKVVGILQESGGFGGTDNSVIMPVSAARTVIEDLDLESDQFSSISVKVDNVDDVDEIVSMIEQKLMLSRHVTNQTKDFSVTTSQAVQETISTVMSTVTLFLAGIAAISLLVGAIGIANTMFMSVMERTKQIGILKALGTTDFEIMKLFLMESAIIGFVGGLLGVFAGMIGSGIVSEIGIGIVGAGARGASTTMVSVTPELVALAISFSVLISIASGVIPARRASKLQPTEALRSE